MTMLPLKFPTSFRDPLYAQLARTAEEKYGLPTGILDAIRTQGERSNNGQVSNAGAQTPYQFIPPTRQGMIRNYGVDPYKDPISATAAAAFHLLESHRRTGSWDKAIAGYEGGIRAERGRGGRVNRDYVSRVGSFDGAQTMPSRYPAPYYGGVDPLAPLPDNMSPEPIAQTVPVPGNAGPSLAMPAASQTASKKRGGVLGALESVFMPEPDSRWAAALRGGLFDAKANQQAYKDAEYNNQLKTMEAEAKLRNLLTKGEFQVVGNNVLWIKPDGSHEMIGAPQNETELQRNVGFISNMPEGPAKELAKRIALGANSDAALASREDQARMRAGATVNAARVRASNKTSALPKPPAGFIVDQ